MKLAVIGIISVDTAQATGYVAYKNLTVPIWRINDVSQTTDFNMGNSGGKISIYNGATLVDSVDFEAAKQRAGWITPVPGGVGPMTRVALLQNTMQAAASHLGISWTAL